MEEHQMRRVQWDAVVLWGLITIIVVGMFVAAQTELRL